MGEGQFYNVTLDPETNQEYIGIWNNVKIPYQGKTITKRVLGALHEHKAKVIESDHRFIFLIAGFGGGKSITGPIWLYTEIRQHPGNDWFIIGPSYPLLARQMEPYFLDLIEQTQLKGHYDTQKHIYYLNPKLDGGKVHLIAARTDGHAHRVQSVHAMGGVIDEAGDISWGVWNAARSRVNQKGGRILITTTARTMSWWLKDDGYDLGDVYRLEGRTWKGVKKGDPAAETLVLQFRSEDNPCFNKEALQSEKDRLSFEEFDTMYGGGIPAVRGLIYPEFDVHNHVITGQAEKLLLERIKKEGKNWEYRAGLDKGFHPHPTAIEFATYDPINNLVIFYDEIAITKSISDQVVAAVDTVNDPNRNPYKVDTVYCGADNPQITQEYNAAAERVKKDILFIDVPAELMKHEIGIAKVRRFISHGRFVVCGSRCPSLVTEMKTYRKELSETMFSREWKTVKKKDDHADACRYLMVMMEHDIEGARDVYLEKKEEQEKPGITEVITEGAHEEVLNQIQSNIPGLGIASIPTANPSRLIRLPGMNI